MADVVYFDGGIELPFCPPTVNGIYISGSGCCSEFYSAFIGGNQTYNLTYTLPTSSGTSGQVLTNDGNGNLSWTTVSGGGGTVSGNYVPYLGATGNTNLGGYGIAGSYFQLSTSTGGTLVPGMFSWNGTDGTADLMLKGGNVTLQLGQEQVTRVINETGANLLESEYKVVRVNGSTGTRLKVALALASGDPTSVETLGVVTENITLNQEGFVTTSGLVKGINTTGSLQGETWLDGDMLFLSPYVAGALTNIKPQAPNHLVVMGYVVTAANNGSIYVKVDNGYELDELHNVLISSAATNNILAYDGVTGVWRNRAASSLNIASGSGTATQLAFWSGATGTTSNTLTSSTGLTWDNTNGRLGVNISTPTASLHVRGTTLTDGGILGAELLSSSGWTSAGWTGDYTTGFTHNTGNTSTLSNSLSAVTNTYYQLTYTVSNRTTGEFIISFGGVSYNSQIASNSQGIRATSTAILTISPTTDFNGKIELSIKEITEGSAAFNIENSNGVITNQIKASLFTSNLFLGLNSGNRITTGTGNAGFGTSALRNNTSGTNNTGIGISVLGVNNTGSSNTGVGTSALQNNTIGIGNTAIGTSSLSNNVNGNSNTAIGVSAISSNSNGANNTAVGHSALTNNGGGDNNTAIGVNALRGFTSSFQNVGIGVDAGYNATTNKTGTGNILIGYQSGVNISSTASNNLIIGTNISLPSATGSSQMVIKNIIFATGASGTGTNILGNVGIGISSPSSRLHIRGSGNNSASTSFLVQNSSSNNMFSVLDNGNIGINTNNPQQTLHVEGTMRLTGSTGTGTTLMGRDANGDVSAITVGSGLSLSGNTLTSTGGGGSGTVTGSGTATQVAFWGGATGTTSTALSGSSNLYWDSVNNRLGVGTNSPSTSLHVNGSLSINNSTPSGSLDVKGEVNFRRTDNTHFLQINNAGAAIDFNPNNGSIILRIRGQLNTDLFNITTSQNNIGIGTATADSSAILHINSNNRGFLPPRMSTTLKTGIASPAQGLVVYDTTMQALSAYNGNNWATVGGGEQVINITGSTWTINFNAGNIADVTLSSSTTLTLSGGTYGTFVIKLTQDATGGRTVSWPSTVKWSGGIPPSLTTTGGKTDIISLIFDGTTYFGTYALNF